MIIQPSQRTSSVKEYYFSKKLKEIDRMNAEGCDPVINLGIGAPDGMPPASAINALIESARQKGNHAYQSYSGIFELRKAFADWYLRYYGVKLDPSCEIQPLVGSKEGILLISMSFLDKGDRVLVPDPGYPTYSSATQLVEAELIPYSLEERNGWHPDFDALENMDLDGVKLMWTNYPNMPTGASATMQLYERLVEFALRHGILICNDNPYSFILNDKPLSILSVPHAKECCLELNSLSKAHNMSGWRIGMVAAEKDIISEILKVKSQMDSGMFKPLQLAAIAALSMGPEWFTDLNAEYRRRRKSAAEIFDIIGARYDNYSTGLFLWGRIDSDNPLLDGSFSKRSKNGENDFASRLYIQDGKSFGEIVSDRILHDARVFITPGFIFGNNGRNYVRISLCADCDVLKCSADRIKSILDMQRICNRLIIGL